MSEYIKCARCSGSGVESYRAHGVTKDSLEPIRCSECDGFGSFCLSIGGRSNEEKDAIQVVKHFGAKFGYGNLIRQLQWEWADMLMSKYNMTPTAAAIGSHMSDIQVEQYVKEKQWKQKMEAENGSRKNMLGA